MKSETLESLFLLKLYFVKIAIIISFFFLPIVGCTQILSPSVIASAGGCDENAYAKISWTLGETVIETETNGDYILTQGFQQSQFNVISVQENALPGYSVNVYPNPFTNQLNVNITSPENSNFQLILFDINGKIIKNCENNTGQNFVFDNLSEYANGVYFLKAISTNSKYDKTFKIEKTGY